MTRLIVADLLPETDYVLQVRAVGPAGVSGWSAAFPVTTIADTTKPKVPSNSTWVVSGDAFYAEWDNITQNVSNEASNISRYEIELVGGGTTKYVSVPQKTESRVGWTLTFEENRALFGTPQPTVTFRVRAVDSKNLKSDWSALRTATNPAPGPVTNLNALAGSGAVEISWVAPADNDIIGYNVHVGTTAGFTPTTANLIYSGLGTKTTYFTTTYSEHWFKVRAVDKFGQVSTDVSDNATPTSPFSVDTTAPAAPTGLAISVANNANGVGAWANISWTAVSDTDLAGYTVRYRRAGTTDNWTEMSVAKDNTAVRVELPVAGVAYEAQVRSRDWSANYSAYTATVTSNVPTSTAPAAVSGFVSTPGRDAIRYDWAAVTSADLKHYEITFSTSSTFASGNTTFTVGGTTLTVAGLTPNTMYYARIRSVNQAGQTSAFSATDTETTLSSSSSVSVSDLTGGTMSNIDMIIGAGASVITQGGAIRSNTYGSSAYNAAAITGFYIDDNNIHIPDGNISAKALKSGTISGTNTITLSGAGAKIVGTGFELSGSGLTVTSGTIAAAALQITSAFSNSVGSSMTTIDGGIIKTGSIQSQTNETINGQTVPTWSIPMNGSASFANLQVRGSAVIGKPNATPGIDDDGGLTTLSSANYMPGVEGWQLRSDGTGELLQLDAQSINGDVIEAGTLTVSSLAGGSLDQEIKLIAGSKIYAEGDMGESVDMSSEGFTVMAPHSATITQATIINSGDLTYQYAILTADGDPGFRPANIGVDGTTVVPEDLDKNSGKILVRNVGSSFDGEWELFSTVTFDANGNAQMRYRVPVGTATVASHAVSGDMLGRDIVDSSRGRNRNIYFPSNGAEPNIISGQLTSAELTITDKAILGPDTQIPAKSIMTMASGITAPYTSATVNFVTPTTILSNGVYIADNDGTSYTFYGGLGVAPMPNGNILTFGERYGKYGTPSATDPNAQFISHFEVHEYSSTGASLGRRVSFNDTTLSDGSYTNDTYYYGIAYYNAKLYVYGYTTNSNAAPATNQVFVDIYNHDTVNNTFGAKTRYNMNVLTHSSDNVTIIGGWNYTNNRIMYSAVFGNSNYPQPKAYEYNIDATTGAPTTIAVNGVTLAKNMSFKEGVTLRGPVGVGGADRYVWKSNYDANGDESKNTFDFFNTSGVYQTGESFSGEAGSVGGYYRSSTDSLYEAWLGKTTVNGVRTYQYQIRRHVGGEAIVSGTTNANKHIGYTWVNSDGSKQTDVGGISSWTQQTRKIMDISIGQIPEYDGTLDTPTKARVYVANQATKPAVNTEWIRRVELTPSQTATTTTVRVEPQTIITPTATGPTSNTFENTGGYGSIVSSSGQSYWRGNDTAQFKNLKVIGAQDVLIPGQAGVDTNTPPLMIGPADGSHIRMDGNEIYSMATPTTRGVLGIQGRFIYGFDFGATTVSGTSTGNFVIPHNLGVTPTSVTVTAQGVNPTWAHITAKTATNFTLQVYNAAGTKLTTTGRTFNWIAFAGVATEPTE